MQTVNPREVGVDPQRVEHLFSVIERKIKEGWLYGGAFLRSILRWHLFADLGQACVVD